MNTDELFIEASKLPKPLDKKTTKELFEKIASGDQEAKKTVINHNIRLVLYQVINRFKNVNYDKKDLVSIGVYGLIKAVEAFDASKQIEFATYATRCIDNEILMFLRKTKRYNVELSLNDILSEDKDGNELNFEDIIADDVNIVEDYIDNETYFIIRQIVNELGEREREIILLHFGFYNNKIYTEKEIAEKIGISQSYVSRLIKKTLKQLKEKIDDYELKSEFKTTSEVKEERQNKKRGPKPKTIYELLSDFTKEEIDEAINHLSDEDKEIIKLKYNKESESKLTTSQKNRFYQTIIPRLKSYLTTGEFPKRGRIKSNVTKSDVKPKVIKPEETIATEMREKFIELFNTEYFKSLLVFLTAKEATVISFKFGYVSGKSYDNDEISKILNIPLEEVRLIIKKVLLIYKKNLNKSINDIIELEESQTLKMEKQ